jgi:hypothetical protein
VRVRFVGGRLVRRVVRLPATNALTLLDTDVDDLSACPGAGDAGSPTDAGATGGSTIPGALTPREVVAFCNQRLSLFVGDGQRPITVSAREGTLPSGLEVSSQTGRLSWFPTPADVGLWRLSVDDGRVTGAIDLRVECTPRNDEVRCGCSAPAPAVLVAAALLMRLGRRRRRCGNSVPSSSP